uniref:putative uncharacterized protein C3orf56 homolog n=1 Tax=Jaculus jaculus TaxID=51337 RepID=UPI001E1B400D|nr:putative uncharacterized protein C3orf56 homolog [Jaculus jaculus]
MATAAAQEQIMKKNIPDASQASKEIHLAAGGTDIGPLSTLCACARSRLVTDLSPWPAVGDFCVGHSYVGTLSEAYPSPWTYTWAPWGSCLWMGQLITVPSVWSGADSSSDPCVESQHLTSIANSIFPFLRETPSASPSVSLGLAGETSRPQVEGQTSASSTPRTAEGSSPKNSPSEWPSSFDLGCPRMPSSPDCHHLTPPPTQDPEPGIPSPGSPWHRVRRRLFER